MKSWRCISVSEGIETVVVCLSPLFVTKTK
uniref:Uncharacterized protein n=1 Tax=Ciona intestinalis TaxID=7719 RepID=H2Y0E4_CIOIN